MVGETKPATQVGGLPGPSALCRAYDFATLHRQEPARIASLVAIPLVLAIVGAFIQETLSRSTVSRDYVQLAVSVLTADKDKTRPELRAWAVDLLNENSSVKFSKEFADRLKGGDIEFPASLQAILSTAKGGIAASPDGKLVAIAQGSEIRVWDLASGILLLSLRGHTDTVTSIEISPDGPHVGIWQLRPHRPALGFIDGTLEESPSGL